LDDEIGEHAGSIYEGRRTTDEGRSVGTGLKSPIC
jgi:hypothetical protein